LAGDRAGLGGTRSSAFWPFWKLMQTLCAGGRAPRLIVIENVCGLYSSHRGKGFDAVCAALAGAGYHFGAVVIDAGLFVPQSRERVFIVAIGADAHIPTELLADGPMAAAPRSELRVRRTRASMRAKYDEACRVSSQRATLSYHSTTGVSTPTKPTVNPPERNGLSYIKSRTKQIANAEENIQRATAIETRRLM
jgi:site-specific DNA-cytosine methylase